MCLLGLKIHGAISDLLHLHSMWWCGLNSVALLLDRSERYGIIMETAFRITVRHLMRVECFQGRVARRIFVVQRFLKRFEIKLICLLKVPFSRADRLGRPLGSEHLRRGRLHHIMNHCSQISNVLID